MLPCRRFAVILADANARLGANADCYSFIAVDFHHLLFAGFYRRTGLLDLCTSVERRQVRATRLSCIMQSTSLLRRGIWLEYATLGWNVVGTVIILIAAVRTGSAALAGFGLDSAIEIFASVVVVWQLKGLEQGRESLALKLIGTAFITLAIYVLVQTVWTLLANAHPAPSPLGIVWLVVTCAVMLLLAWGKLVTGRQLGNLVLYHGGPRHPD